MQSLFEKFDNLQKCLIELNFKIKLQLIPPNNNEIISLKSLIQK